MIGSAFISIEGGSREAPTWALYSWESFSSAYPNSSMISSSSSRAEKSDQSDIGSNVVWWWCEERGATEKAVAVDKSVAKTTRNERIHMMESL